MKGVGNEKVVNKRDKLRPGLRRGKKPNDFRLIEE
jgi:hypothetical protein